MRTWSSAARLGRETHTSNQTTMTTPGETDMMTMLTF